MIICHPYRFIFVKTKKTAGTSVEIALSRFCGDKDVITPISRKDERIRQSMGYKGPRNYYLPLRQYRREDWARLILRLKRCRFYNHASAMFIERHIDPEVWNSYFKFCFERNPWDKVISWYYWDNRTEPRPSISEFVQKIHGNRGFDLYSRHGEVVVDAVYKFEEMELALSDLQTRLGLPEMPALPNAKVGHRPTKRSYRELLSPSDRKKVAELYSMEIEHFDYRW